MSNQRMDQAYGMFKSLANRAKQYAFNLSEIEVKVEEATNNEPWGPTGSQMSGGWAQTTVPTTCNPSLPQEPIAAAPLHRRVEHSCVA